MSEWYKVSNADTLDTPCLLIYPDHIQENIQRMLARVDGQTERLRPHVKTYKMQEVVEMQMQAGINKFKFATIAEGEMLGQVKVREALLAYQPTGPKVTRLLELIKAFPETQYAALVDNPSSASFISDIFAAGDLQLPVYLDLDVGMHRTGMLPDEQALELFQYCNNLPGLKPEGLHIYDGHLRQAFEERKQVSDEAFQQIELLQANILKATGQEAKIVAGGSPTFPIHAQREGVECSPGTCLLWDWGYSKILAEQDFLFAGLVMSRVISHPGNNRICVDLGHKSIAAENPFPRVHFLNLPEAKQVGQSEEHLVLELENRADFPVGTILYGLPLHICPTCALYERAQVVRGGSVVESWRVIARDRTISI